MPLIAQPGKAWNYSIATDVLGYLVEVVSGMPFEKFLMERVIKPLKMVDTDFWVPEAKQARFAANYSADGKGGLTLIDDPGKSRYLKPRTVNSGGGGLVSTASDYARFCQFMLNKGELDGVRLLGRKTVELMTSNHLPGDMASMGAAALLGSDLRGQRLRARLRRHARPGHATRSSARLASMPGAAPPRPRSGSIRPRRCTSSC